MAITVFSSLYTTRLILDALGTGDFGIFALVGGLISMLMFLNGSMTLSSQRFMSFAKGKNDFNEEKTVFNISIVLHLGIAFIMIALLEIAGPYLFNNVLTIDPSRVEAAKMIYHFMIFSTFFTIVSVPYDAVINANEDMLFVSILGIVESFIKLAIAFYITSALGDKLIIYGYMMASISFIVMIIKSIYSHRKYDEVTINIFKYFDKVLFRKIMNFAGYTMLGLSTQMITSYGQGIILNMFFGTIVNAAQGIVAQVSGQLGVFAFTMLKALNPMIIKSEGSGNRKLMLDASFIGMKMSFYLLALFYIPVLLEMPTIFGYWLVNVPEYTIVFGTLLLARNLIEQLYVTLYTSILSVGNIKYFQVYNSILNLLPLPVAYIFFTLGYLPSTIYVIFIVYTLFQASIYIYYANKECGMLVKEYFKKVVVKSIIPFVFIFLIVYIPHSIIVDELYRLLIVIVVNFISFTIIIWKFGLVNMEKVFILQLFNKLKSKVIINEKTIQKN